MRILVLVLRDIVCKELDKIAPLVAERLNRYTLKGRTGTVKIKFHDFKISTCSRSVDTAINDAATIASIAKALLTETIGNDAKVRLLGITLFNFGEKLLNEKESQLQLFA